MFHLGRISFVASGKTPESSKLIFVFIRQAQARMQGAGEPGVPGGEGAGAQR